MLLNAAIEGIEKIYTNQRQDRYAVLGAISHPEFKVRWFPIVETKYALSKGDLKQLLITECKLFQQDLQTISNPTQLTKDIANEDFFDFNEDVTPSVENKNRVQLEVLQQLNDLRKNITMLDSYPLIKKSVF